MLFDCRFSSVTFQFDPNVGGVAGRFVADIDKAAVYSTANHNIKSLWLSETVNLEQLELLIVALGAAHLAMPNLGLLFVNTLPMT